MRDFRYARITLGTLLIASVAVTEAVLLLEGRWREAIPLHLCSLSAIAAAWLTLQPHRILLEFLWYLGIPGALLALVFPAPAVSRFQQLLSASYMMTHLLIVVIPVIVMLSGMRPRTGRSWMMLIALQGLALLAYGVNRMLGTDFFFLMAPPAGTPLESVYAWGYPLYLLTLEILMIMTCLGMEMLLGRIGTKDTK